MPRTRTDVGWLSLLREARIAAGEAAPVTAVCFDSRAVTPGAVFVAVPGLDTDGHNFLRDAIDRGAAALLVQGDRRALWEPLLASGTTVVVVPDARAALAKAAAGFYGRPAAKLGVIGVTGAGGKRTTVHLIAHLLESAGRPAGYLSSAAFRSNREAARNESHMTTLEAPFVQQQLA